MTRQSSLLVALILFAIPETALAYIGPGAGLAAIGSVLALVGAIVLAIVGFLWYPIKRWRRSKSTKAPATKSPTKR
jgi:hypothetical protein